MSDERCRQPSTEGESARPGVCGNPNRPRRPAGPTGTQKGLGFMPSASERITQIAARIRALPSEHPANEAEHDSFAH